MGTPSKLSRSSTRKLECFISAPFGCNTDSLRDTLTSVGVRTFRIDDLSPAIRVVEAVSAAMERADFVCAFFPAKFPTTSTLFELGAAFGAKRPTLILKEEGVALPFDLVGLRIVQVDLGKPETIATAVRGFISSLNKAPVPYSAVGPGGTHRIDAAKARNALRQISTGAESFAEFEHFIAQLFREAGFATAVEDEVTDTGVDIALWIDRLDPIVGNPVLVEVKASRFDHRKWKADTEQLRKYLLNAGAHCGLLITRDSLPADIPEVTPSMPLIMTFSADELIRALGEGNFVQRIIERRNRAVHGRVQ